MRLKKMIIDGFKSYQYRTEIGPFDAKFNAITGLNGSGKSNILDAICFVLGISLSSIRTSRLHEVIYKKGTAGVVKAQVSLIFDNTDRSTSPKGFEDIPELTITRIVSLHEGIPKSRYLVNSSRMDNNKVESLFHSINLNVHNPHFLIMQGRITKVLSMKPPEVLSLLEETAGTKQYDEECARTRQVFEKKSRKVAEINAIISEELAPKLEQLRKDQAIYEQYKELEQRIAEASRRVVAYQYMAAQRVLASDDGERLRQREQQLVAEHEAVAAQLEDAGRQLKAKRKEQASSAALDQLLNDKDEAENARISLEQDKQHLEQLLADTQRKAAAVAQRLQQARAELDGAATSSSSSSSSSSSLNDDSAASAAEEVQRLEKELLLVQRRFEAASSGAGDVADDSGDGKSMAELLRETQQSVQKAEAAIKKAERQRPLVEKRLTARRQETRDLDADTLARKDKHAALRRQVDALRAQLQAMGPAESTEALDSERQRLLDELRRRRAEAQQLQSGLGALSFRYDQKKCRLPAAEALHGRLGSLVYVKDKAAAMALEVAAGGQLRKVVVDSTDTAKLLIRDGISTRESFLALDVAADWTIPAAEAQRAADIAERASAWCAPAYTAVEPLPRWPGSEAALGRAMKNAFGGAFICQEAPSKKGVARRIALESGLNRKTVTFDGDSYDPSGKLTGGYRAQAQSSTLLHVRELHDVERDIAALQAAVAELEARIARLRQQEGERARLQHDVDIAERQAAAVQQQIDRSPQQQILNDVARLEAELRQLDETAREAHDAAERGRAEIARLQAAVRVAADNRDAILGDIQRQRDRVDEQLRAAKQRARDAGQREQQQRIERQSLEGECAALADQQRALADDAERQARDVEAAAGRLQQLRQSARNLKELIAAEQTRIAEHASELKQLQERKLALQQAEQDAGVAVQQAGAQLRKLLKDRADAEQLLRQLADEHRWIDGERRFFGQPGSEFDLAAFNVQESQASVRAMEQAKEALSNRINRKVLVMFQSVENEYAALVRRRETLEADRVRIENFMLDNDVKKKALLMHTYETVNRNFGKIFAELLPGARAQLAPQEGQTFEQGLCFQVAFGAGTPWKKSLTELSGGQRSLLALALILGLLRCKPAPLYILDEIDSALDLSHTQNIGEVIRHPDFGSSQFIVVSLKEGMFNNANTIFKTQLYKESSRVSVWSRSDSS